MKTYCDASCGLHELAKGKKDTGIYKCDNCMYCKDKHITLGNAYVGECKHPLRKTR